MGRVQDKIKEAEEYLSELEEIAPNSFEEYMNNLEKRLACERALEKIIEAVNDLAILFIKEKKLPMPDEDIKAFDILSKRSTIPAELSEKLKQAKGMRNFISHQYGKINNELVFEAIDGEILRDARLFINLILKK